MLTLALATSLWAASHAEPVRPPQFIPPPQVMTPGRMDKLAGDLALNAFGTAGDLISTDWAISRGCTEGNPLLPRVEGRIGVKVGLMAFRGGMAYVLRSRGHSKAADAFRWAGLAVDSALTINNVWCGSR